MQLWLDVYDANGNRLGDGPITTVISCTVNRVLDGVGTITFNTVATDPRALALLQTRRRFRIYVNDLSGTREIARGIILKRKFQESGGSASWSFTCADALHELKDYNTLIARKIIATFGGVCQQLIELVPGWTIDIETNIETTLARGDNGRPSPLRTRFDGVSVLKALQLLVKNHGVHFRLGSGALVEVGAFGDSAPFSVLNAGQLLDEVVDNPAILIVDRLEKIENGEDVVNWIIPLGGGTDTAAVKLKKSTRTAPYTIIKEVNQYGQKHWYMADEISIAKYGRVQRVVSVKDIVPISNTEVDKTAAANALYDAATAYLERNALLQQSYKFSLKGARAGLRPGQKIKLRYVGRVYQDGQVVDYIDVDELFWIMKVSETYNANGVITNLDISNVDKTEASAINTIIQVIEDVEIQKLTPTAAQTIRPFVYYLDVRPNVPAIAPLEITNATLEVIRVRVRVRTLKALRHRHQVSIAGGPVGAAPTYDWEQHILPDVNFGLLPVQIPTDTPFIGTSKDLYTYYDSEAQIYDEVPTFITLKINGVDVTTKFGGPWATGGTNQPEEFLLDVAETTDAILSASELQQTHTFEFTSQTIGRLEITIEAYEVTQTIELDD
jgi:hypothetical protein